MAKKKNELHETFVTIIDKVVKPENRDYGREYKILKKLWVKNPDKKVWVNLPFKVNSLAFFLTDKGKEELKKVINLVNYTPPATSVKVVLEENKIGEDAQIDKPLSIKDFLKKYK